MMIKNKWIKKITLLETCVLIKTIITETIKNIDNNRNDNISSSNDNNNDNSNL